VGANGNGRLEISNGGIVNAFSVNIGSTAGAGTGSGFVTVSGTGSKFTSDGGMNVGNWSNGTLVISAGGSVTASLSNIAYADGVTGSVTVTGQNSQWILNGSLDVGFGGKGTLEVTHGGFVSSRLTYIGANSSPQLSSVTVSHTGSRWTTQSLYIGGQGRGQLRITDGGFVSSAASAIGLSSGSTGDVTITGADSQWVVDGSLDVGRTGSTGTLQVESGGTLSTRSVKGTGTLSLNGATLRALATSTTFINFSAGGTFRLLSGGGTIDSDRFNIGANSALSGTGSLTKTGAGRLTLTAASTYTGGTNVQEGTFMLSAAGGIASAGGVNIAGGATFSIEETTANSGNYTFANPLTGSGLLSVSLLNNGNVFGFTGATGSAFTGTVVLGKSTFSLSGSNTTTLVNATLRLDSGNLTTVAAGNQAIGNFTMNGGIVSFANPPSGQITTGALALTSGTVRVDAGMLAGIAGNLLVQDEGMQQRLITATSVTGQASNLTLADLAGNALQSSTANIAQGGNTVAVASYGYVLSNDSTSLWASYRLTQLNLQNGRTLSLSGDAALPSGANDMTAKITGSGNLDISATTLISLANSSNDYTGTTRVSSGTLQLAADGVLGNTSQLNILSGATADINGRTQIIGALAGDGTLNVNGGLLTISNGGAFGGVISGTAGSLTLAGGTLTLTGTNAYTGTMTVNSGATLQIGSGGALGNYGSNITDNGSVIFSRSDSMTYAGVVSGAGTLTQAGSGTLTLTGVNTYTGGTRVSGGILRLTGTGSVGSGAVTISTASGNMTTGLDLAFTGGASFANMLSGSGTTTVSGDVRITGLNSGYAGLWNVTGTASVNPASTTSTANFGTGRADVTGTLNLTSTGAYAFANALTGTGSVTASNGGGAFSFGSGVGSAFAGTVTLSNNTFMLSGNDTAALTNATLMLGSNNVTTVGTGNQNIGTLVFNGGTLKFNTSIPAQTQASGTVVADHLDLSGTGKVSVNLPTAPGMVNPPTLSNTNLLSQDDDGALVKLAGIANGGTVSGQGGGLTLTDQSGNLLSNGQSVNIAEGGNTVAVGIYDYRLNTGLSGDGLYVAYALKSVDLLSSRTLTLTPDASASGSALDFSAMVTGAGNLAITGASGQVVSLSNGANTYTGTTTVTRGTLQLGASGALGTTSQLSIASGAAADINGHTQIVGSLAGAGTLNVNNGSLTVSNGGTFSGVLTGTGSLVLSGGALAVTGTGNGSLSAAVTIANGATATLSATSGLGNSGTITAAGMLAFNGAVGNLTKSVDGAGSVSLTNGSSVTLLATNSLSGSWNTAVGTTLTASVADNLGTASVSNSGSFVVNTTTDWTLANPVSGSGSFTKSGAGNLTIAQANAGMTGTTMVSGGVLTLLDATGAGTGEIMVSTAAGSTTTGLDLAFAGGASFTNALSGSGTTKVSGDARITGLNSGYAGLWNITGTASVDSASMTSTMNLGTGRANVTGALNLTSMGAFAFHNALTGNGLVSASNGGGAFSFGTGVGSDFEGVVALSNNTFDLSGNNMTALAKAKLVVGNGNITTVGTGIQTISGLGFDRGTLKFNVTEPAEINAGGTLLMTGVLEATGSGNIQIATPSPLPVEPPTISTELSLFEQDSANIIVRLVDASGATVIGGGGNLTLVDQGGNLLTNDTIIDLSNTTGGPVVAEGHYDYRLTTGPDGDGLYINYGLIQVDLIGTGANALVLSPRAGATGQAADLSAQIGGAGDLAIATGAGDHVSLSNSANDYTGTTFVRSGTLLFGNDNVLGLTDNLMLDAGTAVDMAGYSQSVGALNTATGSDISISGTLTITDGQRLPGDMNGGGIESGTLSGNGTLVIDPSIVHVNGAQTGYTGKVTVTGGSQLLLNAADAFDNAFGIELTSATDILTFGDLSSYDPAWTGIASGTMQTSLSGLGTVQVLDGSDIALAGSNGSFAGRFEVAANSVLWASQADNLGTAGIDNDGTFIATASNSWVFANVVTGTGTFVKNGSGVLQAGDFLLGFTGLTQIDAGMLQFGAVSAPGTIGGSAEIASGATLAGLGTVAGDVTSSGTVSPGLDGTFGTMTVAGNYVATNGSVHISSRLGDDASPTDRLIVSGDVSGTSTVKVSNLGGYGAETINGIQIIQVGGVSPGNAFVLSGDYTTETGEQAVIGGVYAYTLQYGGMQTQGDGNWYLVSELTFTDPESGEGGDSFRYQPGTPLYEQYPQVLASLNTVPTLQQRVGNRYWQPNAAGSSFGTYGMWGRVEGSRSESEAARSTTLAHRSTDLWRLQTGFDFVLREGADGSLLVGGVNISHGTALADIGSPYGRGKIDTTGTGIGATLTWYGANGFYVDTQAQAMFFDSDITSTTIGRREVKGNNGHGYALSGETGFRYQLGNCFSLTPQMQLVWSRVDFDSFTDPYGARVSLRNGDSLRGRLGLSLDYEKGWTAADGTKSRAHVYAIANLYNEFLNGSKVSVENTSFRSRDERLWAGVGLGGTYEWNNGRYALYGNVNVAGSTRKMSDNHSFGGTLGFRATW